MWRLFRWMFGKIGPYVVGILIGIGFAIFLLNLLASHKGSGSLAAELASFLGEVGKDVMGSEPKAKAPPVAPPSTVARMTSPPTPLAPAKSVVATPPPSPPSPLSLSQPVPTAKAGNQNGDASPAPRNVGNEAASKPPTASGDQASASNAGAPGVVAAPSAPPSGMPGGAYGDQSRGYDLIGSAPNPNSPSPPPYGSPPYGYYPGDGRNAPAAPTGCTPPIEPSSYAMNQFYACFWRQTCLNRMAAAKQMIEQGKSRCPTTGPNMQVCLNYYQSLDGRYQPEMCDQWRANRVAQ